eukprot:gene8293-8742_t
MYPTYLDYAAAGLRQVWPAIQRLATHVVYQRVRCTDFTATCPCAALREEIRAAQEDAEDDLDAAAAASSTAEDTAQEDDEKTARPQAAAEAKPCLSTEQWLQSRAGQKARRASRYHLQEQRDRRRDEVPEFNWFRGTVVALFYDNFVGCPAAWVNIDPTVIGAARIHAGVSVKLLQRSVISAAQPPEPLATGQQVYVVLGLHDTEPVRLGRSATLAPADRGKWTDRPRAVIGWRDAATSDGHGNKPPAQVTVRPVRVHPSRQHEQLQALSPEAIATARDALKHTHAWNPWIGDPGNYTHRTQYFPNHVLPLHLGMTRPTHYYPARHTKYPRGSARCPPPQPDSADKLRALRQSSEEAQGDSDSDSDSSAAAPQFSRWTMSRAGQLRHVPQGPAAAAERELRRQLEAADAVRHSDAARVARARDRDRDRRADQAAGSRREPRDRDRGQDRGRDHDRARDRDRDRDRRVRIVRDGDRDRDRDQRIRSRSRDRARRGAAAAARGPSITKW